MTALDLIRSAQATPLQKAQKEKREIIKTSSLDFVLKKLSQAIAGYEVYWYYIEPNKDEKNLNKQFIHRGLPKGGKGERFSVRAGMILIKNYQSNSDVHIYFSDQNGDGYADSIGISERFGDSPDYFDMGVIHVEVKKKTTPEGKIYPSFGASYSLQEITLDAERKFVSEKNISEDSKVLSLARKTLEIFRRY